MIEAKLLLRCDKTCRNKKLLQKNTPTHLFLQ